MVSQSATAITMPGKDGHGYSGLGIFVNCWKIHLLGGFEGEEHDGNVIFKRKRVKIEKIEFKPFSMT